MSDLQLIRKRELFWINYIKRCLAKPDLSPPGPQNGTTSVTRYEPFDFRKIIPRQNTTAYKTKPVLGANELASLITRFARLSLEPTMSWMTYLRPGETVETFSSPYISLTGSELAVEQPARDSSSSLTVLREPLDSITYFNFLVRHGMLLFQGGSSTRINCYFSFTKNRPPASFSQLPTEIRLVIWELARPDPRAVKLERSAGPDVYNVYSRAKVPNLLGTCRESRALALKWYTLSFGVKCKVPIPRFQPKTYFDWSVDFLYASCKVCRGNTCGRFNLKCALSLYGVADIMLVKRLVYETSGTRSRVIADIAHWFRGVEDLRLVHWMDGIGVQGSGLISDLVESPPSDDFSWQGGSSLVDLFLKNRISVHLAQLRQIITPRPLDQVQSATRVRSRKFVVHFG